MRNRWIRLGLGTIVFMALGLIYAWSVFKTPISAVFRSWTFSQLSLTFTFSMIVFCLSGMISGKLYMKYGPLPILAAAACLMAAGFWAISFMNPGAPEISLIVLYVSYGIGCSAGVGLAYNALLSAVLEWFPDKNGLVSGTLLMGYGIGGMLLGNLVLFLIERTGLFVSFRILGVFMPAMMVLGIFVAKDRPESRKRICSQQMHERDGRNTETNAGGVADRKYAAGKSYGKSTADMLADRSFWLMMLWLIILGSIGLLVVNSAASVVAAYGVPESLGLLVSVFNGFGRIVVGAVYDRYKGLKAMLFNSLLFLTSGVMLLLGDALLFPVLIVAGLAFAGCGYGGDPTIASALVRDEYGERYYSMNFAIVNLSMIPSSILGPMISSTLIERSGGSFASTFQMVLILAAGAMIVYVFLAGQGRKKEAGMA